MSAVIRGGLILAAFALAAPLACAQVERFACETRKAIIEGAKTQIGEAWVTAGHVAEPCGYDREPDMDLAILESGETGSCRNAEIGENVFLVGFPEPEGDVQRGVVIGETEIGGRMMTVAMARGVRSGFSGGPAISTDDERITGIILSVGVERPDGFRPVIVLPVETICERINR